MKRFASPNWRLIPLFLVFSCSQEDDNPCRFADQITVPQSCYNPMAGLPLTASGYSPTGGGLEWEVYVSQDTSINALDNLSLKTGGGETLIVPDSVLRDYPKILVKVVTNCQGQLLHSPYVSFVRRQVNNCTTWVPQKIR